MLTELAPDLWEATQPLRVMGFDLGHRMTVVRLGSGELVLHSPIHLSSAIMANLQKLGSVSFILAPSSMHDLYLKEWMDAYPKALLLHSPALKAKGTHANRSKPIDNENLGELETAPINGMPKIQERAFLHRPSKTLIVCDLVFNLPPGRGFQKLLQKMNGIYERLGCSKFYKSYIASEENFRESVQQLLQADFERLIVGHGANVDRNAREQLHHSLSWLKLAPIPGRSSN
ncbi:MAG: DUF4336 domain-containing protein [Verrucomicrobiales bacterium]